MREEERKGGRGREGGKQSEKEGGGSSLLPPSLLLPSLLPPSFREFGGWGSKDGEREGDIACEGERGDLELVLHIVDMSDVNWGRTVPHKIFRKTSRRVNTRIT